MIHHMMERYVRIFRQGHYERADFGEVRHRDLFRIFEPSGECIGEFIALSDYTEDFVEEDGTTTKIGNVFTIPSHEFPLHLLGGKYFAHIRGLA